MEKHTKSQPDGLQDYISEGTCKAIRMRYGILASKARQTDYGELDRDVVVLDTETTGFSFNHDELIEIAAARMKDGKIVDWFITFVNPGKPIPEEISHLTSITDKDVADAPTPEKALSDLVEFVGTSDIVAHNAEFDKTFVTKNMYGTPLNENLWIDSLDLARIALPRLKSHRLLDLARAFGAPVSTHRADADVAATCCIYRILLAAVDSMPQHLVAEIARMATESEWPTVKVFRSFTNRADERGASQEELAESAPAQSEVFAEGSPSLRSTEGSSPSSDDASSRPSKPFSLRSLRNERLNPEKGVSKVDADSLAADSHKGLWFPEAEEISCEFDRTGLIGSLYENYETRDEQKRMAQAVAQAFATSRNLAVEAGTGVGKSMAYLFPSALIARKNNITIGVATKTNALLDQLIHKELPLLAASLREKDTREALKASERKTGGDAGKTIVAEKGEEAGSKASETPIAATEASPLLLSAAATPRPLTYSALKGFSHYACLRKVDKLVREGAKIAALGDKRIPQAPSLAALLSYIEQSEYDDIDGLKIDYRAIPRYSVTTTSHDCLRRKCPYYGQGCFVHGARKRAEEADIVVTNHSLLFCDIAAEGGLLPPIRYWVVDEAHGTEAEARRSFSPEISAEDIMRLARRVAADDAASSVYMRAQRQVGAVLENNALWHTLMAKARSAAKTFEQTAQEFTKHIKDLAFFSPDKKNKGYDIIELWINEEIRQSETFKSLVAFGRIFYDSAEKLVTHNQELVGFLEEIDEAAEIQRELASITINLKEMLDATEKILFIAPPAYAYSATLSKKNDRVVERMQALLLDVGEVLNESFFASTHSVVFASATLTIADSFDPFAHALGLNATENSQTDYCRLDSSYDFDTQMTVYVPDDIPEPSDPHYLEALQKFLVEVHRAQEGSFLTLFTNRKEMEKCFDVVQAALKTDGLRLICQKWGVSTKGLRDEFLADEHLSLFALKSFWEGFDAPGATLKGVIIPKLPFAKPTDPLSCERAHRDSQAWSRYVLPSAILETKQAAGRLIRGADDFGCLILADRRLVSKRYGTMFLRSLPSKTVKICSTTAIAEELTEAYKRHIDALE